MQHEAGLRLESPALLQADWNPARHARRYPAHLNLIQVALLLVLAVLLPSAHLEAQRYPGVLRTASQVSLEKPYIPALATTDGH
jgi:hypothetical protein